MNKIIFSVVISQLLYLCSVSSAYSFASPAWLPELYKILIESKHLKNIPYSKFIKGVKQASPQEILLLCKAAPKGEYSKTLVSVAVEKKLIPPTQSIMAEKELKHFENYFSSLKDKGVPYASGKMERYFKDLSEKISKNKPFSASEISQETKQLINGGLAGTRHPVTGVLYNSEGFPVFNSAFEAILPKALYKATDAEQFRYATKELLTAITNNPQLRGKFSAEQLEQIASGYKPKGYTWHHHEELGKIQLVETRIHQSTPHRGGKAIWGGGSANR